MLPFGSQRGEYLAAVNPATMTEFQDDHDDLFVIDAVDHPVAADSNSIDIVVSKELAAPGRTRSIGQFLDRAPEPQLYLPW